MLFIIENNNFFYPFTTATCRIFVRILNVHTNILMSKPFTLAVSNKTTCNISSLFLLISSFSHIVTVASNELRGQP